MSNKIDPKALLEAGVHFGHRTDKWNPKMQPFIYEARNGIYVINLVKTAEQIEKACEFLRKTSASGGKVLIVGCKKQSQEIVREISQKAGTFYVNNRWLGGTLTNLNTIRKSVGRLKFIENLETTGKINEMPKQEASALRREATKLHKNLDGLRDMEKPPAAMIVVDTAREEIAVHEAHRLNIPVVAINDTNSDPSAVDYPIPANDDAIRSIRIILEYLVEAIQEGAGEHSSKGKSSVRNQSAEATAVSA
jgi:small subunit ribosomal protein S2